MAISVTELQRRLYELVQDQICDKRVLELLWEDAQFTYHEDAIWDFKREINLDPKDKNSDDEYNARCCELVKDIVAFYNTYGGYIIVGVSDADRSLVGFSKPIDIDTVMQRIKSDTAIDVHFTYASIEFMDARLAIILVPRRVDAQPLAFKKQAKAFKSGKASYKAKDILLRDGARSIAAETVDQLSFLFGSRTRASADFRIIERSSILDNNLRMRDPSLIEFIGRDEDLAILWRWLGDKFNPVKLVSGIGGVGKTTLVRAFSEQVLERSPLGFERVIWLTAKRAHWRTQSGNVEKARKEETPQFDSLITLLSALAAELGTTKEEIAEATDNEGLPDLVLEALKITPAFIVIDDLDTLDTDSQYEVFQTITSIIHHARQSKAIITARLKLGAAASQVLQVKGFDKEEFRRYVDLLAAKYQVALNLHGKPKLFEKFYRLSGGSPLYAAEIIRLVGRGHSGLDQCLESFKDKDGEQVRKFSFERELEALTESQLRLAYALSILERASFAELKEATESGEDLLIDDLKRLRDYHLVASSELPTAAGQVYEAEASIVLLRELIAQKLSAGPRRIETRCKRLREATGKRKTDAGLAISRIIALWEQGRPADALEVAEYEAKAKGQKHPDLQCFLGRAFLRVDPPQADSADAAFRSAYGLGCTRPELFDLWIEAKRARGDWRGVLDTVELAVKQRLLPKYILEKGRAHFALAEEAKRGGNYSEAISHFRRCARTLNDAIKNLTMSGLFEDAKELRKAAYLEAIAAAKISFRSPGDALEIWTICHEAFAAYVRTRSVIVDGVENLTVWAGHVVEFREKITDSTKGKLRSALDELINMERILYEKHWDDAAATQRLRDGIQRMRRLIAAMD